MRLWQYITQVIKEKYKIRYSKKIRRVKLLAKLQLHAKGFRLKSKDYINIPYFLLLDEKDWEEFETIIADMDETTIRKMLSKVITIAAKYCSAPLAKRVHALLKQDRIGSISPYFQSNMREYLEELSRYSPPIKHQEEFKKRLVFDLHTPLTRKEDILFIPYWGPGDEVLPAAALQFIEREMSTDDNNIHVLCDHRLHGLFSRSFRKIHFIKSHRKRYASFSDYARFRKLPTFDLHAIFCNDSYPAALRIRNWASIYMVPLQYLDAMHDWQGGGFLQPDPELVRTFRQHMNARALKVGLCWRSTLLTHKRLGYWHVDDLHEILNTQGIQFYIYQHGMSSHERNIARRYGCMELEELDLYNDFEGLAASMANLDLFIGPPTFNTWLAAAVGCPTIMLDSTLLRSPPFRNPQCFWNKAIRIFAVNSECRKEFVIHELAEELERSRLKNAPQLLQDDVASGKGER